MHCDDLTQFNFDRLKRELGFVRFALENLRRIHYGEGGTAKIDPATGFPLRCRQCGDLIYHGHDCFAQIAAPAVEGEDDGFATVYPSA